MPDAKRQIDSANDKIGLRLIRSYSTADRLKVAAEWLRRESPAFSASFVLPLLLDIKEV